jgi:hypothetical protein
MRPTWTGCSVVEQEDAAAEAYLDWREKCLLVQDAYDAWTHKSAGRTPYAFEAYQGALDREEHSAAIYARTLRWQAAKRCESQLTKIV